jgi:hypothetical protein
MLDLEARADALCAAPAGCAFLLAAEWYGLTPEEAAQPAASIHLAAEALAVVNPWNIDRAEVKAKLLHGPRLASFARSILSQPETSWWLGPLNRNTQEWISRSGEPPTPPRLIIPKIAPDDFEGNAHKPIGGLFTSTGIAGANSALALLSHGWGDYGVDPPIVRYRLRADPTTRIYEIDGPAAWHQLCTQFPALGEDGRLVPDWNSIADEWDGVHLTLGGLLTSEQVRFTSPAGWTELREWDAEQTVWLRWVFDAVEPLPILERLPPSPLVLPDPIPPYPRVQR